MLEMRHFHHYTQHFHHFTNTEKLEKLCTNEVTLKFKQFITDTVLAHKVPDEFFTNDKQRCSSQKIREGYIVEKPSRYRKIIETALANQNGRERHYVVLKALVENVATNVVSCEVPVWSENGETVGHIDCVEIFPLGIPQIFVSDFKPHAETELPLGQVLMNKILLAQLCEIPLRNIGMLWFDQIGEYIVCEDF